MRTVWLISLYGAFHFVYSSIEFLTLKSQSPPEENDSLWPLIIYCLCILFFFVQVHNLQRLLLNKCGISDESGPFIFQGISQCRSLARVELKSNEIGALRWRMPFVLIMVDMLDTLSKSKPNSTLIAFGHTVASHSARCWTEMTTFNTWTFPSIF